MAEICHLENRHDVIFFCQRCSDLDKISETGAEWHVDCGDVVEMETRCRFPIWRTFVRIQRHVIPQPPATLQGAATWRIQCHDSWATCHIAGAATGWIQWHVIPEPRITLQGAATWWIHCHDSRATCHIAECNHLVKSMSWSCHFAGCKNFIRHIENCLRHILFIYLCFFKCKSGFDERRLSCRLRYTCLLTYPGEVAVCSLFDWRFQLSSRRDQVTRRDTSQKLRWCVLRQSMWSNIASSNLDRLRKLSMLQFDQEYPHYK